MIKGRIVVWIIFGFTLTVLHHGRSYGAPLNGAASTEAQSVTGKITSQQDRPVQLAGLLDSLLDPNSKESKILQGATSILSSTGEINYKSELTIGESLALEGFGRYGMPVKDSSLQEYVNLVGMAVARNSIRPEIPYYFVVVKSPLQNAFACPGGIIFLSSGLLNTVQTEAQLAGVLAHEVAHVAHKHALKSIQRARFFKGVGTITAATMEGEKGKQFEDMIGGLENILFDKGLDKNMEFEADQSALETTYRTGYDPDGLVEVLKELKRIEASSTKKGSWFSTHPPLSERIGKCQTQLKNYPDRASLAELPDRFKDIKKKIPK